MFTLLIILGPGLIIYTIIVFLIGRSKADNLLKDKESKFYYYEKYITKNSSIGEKKIFDRKEYKRRKQKWD